MTTFWPRQVFRYFLLGLFLALGGAVLTLGSAQADPQVTVQNPRITYTFGDQLVFAATIQSSSPIQGVELFYHAQGLPYTLTAKMALDDQGEVLYIHNLRQQPLPPFVEVAYWFRVTFQDGGAVTTPPQHFLLEDNRFVWSALKSPPFVVHWYEGDAGVAQQVVNAAQQGLLRMQQQWQAPLPTDQVDIYIYASIGDLQSALAGLPHWAAGHADPALGKIFLSLPPGLTQGLEAQRQVPHELAHVLLYQATLAGYAHLPRWLNEGVASLAELVPNPDYDAVLQQAIEQQGLLPIAALCADFPPQAAQTILAYAESASLTRYIYRTYGSAGLRRLIEAYAQGQGCEEAPRAALGKPLSQIERAWLASLGVGRDWSWLSNLAPWLGLLLLVTLPLGVMALGFGEANPQQGNAG